MQDVADRIERGIWDKSTKAVNNNNNTVALVCFQKLDTEVKNNASIH